MENKEKHLELVSQQRLALNNAKTDSERQEILNHYGPKISRANSNMQADGYNPSWHYTYIASGCCCTPEDDRHGCGCGHWINKNS